MKPIIIANWKMNPKGQVEAKALFNSVKSKAKNIKKAQIIICPPFVYLPLLKGLALGSENCFWEQEGAYTGEISPNMIKSIGVKYAIVGHSERRKYFNETDEEVNKKIKTVLKEGLIPIFCVGETQVQRDKGETEAILKRQIISGLESISSAKFSKGMIAYEPVWAIGTGNACDIEEAQKMMLLIRKIVSKIYNNSFSRKIPVLYGGSVKSHNARGYIEEAGFNGLLVGGASLNAGEFVKIVKESI